METEFLASLGLGVLQQIRSVAAAEAKRAGGLKSRARRQGVPHTGMIVSCSQTVRMSRRPVRLHDPHLLMFSKSVKLSAQRERERDPTPIQSAHTRSPHQRTSPTSRASVLKKSRHVCETEDTQYTMLHHQGVGLAAVGMVNGGTGTQMMITPEMANDMALKLQQAGRSSGQHSTRPRHRQGADLNIIQYHTILYCIL